MVQKQPQFANILKFRGDVGVDFDTSEENGNKWVKFQMMASINWMHILNVCCFRLFSSKLNFGYLDRIFQMVLEQQGVIFVESFSIGIES